MQPLHVAIFPFSGSGHINPLLELARRLIPLEFRVSFLIPQAARDKIQIQDDQIHLTTFSQPLAFLPTPELIEEVTSVVKALQPPVKCLISDCFISFAQDMADNLNIPWVALWTGSALAEAICANTRLLISEGYVPVNAHPDKNDLITFIPGVPPLHRTQLPFPFHKDNPVMLPLGDTVLRSKDAICVLVNAAEELEQETVNGRRTVYKEYLPVGPLIPADFLKLDKLAPQGTQSPDDLHCINWLDTQAPHSVLYIAFGSVTSLKLDKVQKLSDAVKANGQPFLWAIRKNFIPDAPEDFHRKLKDEFGAQGLIVEWAPQASVLRHPSVGAFLTHCGWNSTMETICAGVPTLCWPCGAEQNLNSFNMINKWRIGKKVADSPEEDVKVEDIKAAIRAVMEGEEGTEMRNEIQGLRKLVTDAFQGGCSEKNLHTFKNIVVDALSRRSFSVGDGKCGARLSMHYDGILVPVLEARGIKPWYSEKRAPSNKPK